MNPANETKQHGGKSAPTTRPPRDFRGSARIFLAHNGTLIGVVLLIALFATQNDNFLSFRNAQVIGQGIAELGVIAAILALLVIAGSVDLSVGSVASMAGIVAGKVMVDSASSQGASTAPSSVSSA